MASGVQVRLQRCQHDCELMTDTGKQTGEVKLRPKFAALSKTKQLLLKWWQSKE